MTNMQTRLSPESVYNQRKALVKEMVAKERAEQDAKTARLRALRMAKQTEDQSTGNRPSSERRSG